MSQSFAEALGWVIKSPHLVASLDRALNYAFQQQHRHVTLDHLLLALSEDSDALLVLRASNVDIEQLRNAISDLVGRNEDRAAQNDPGGPTASSELITIFEYASAAADQSGREVIDGAIVLAALIGEGTSPAARLLQTHGLTFDHAINSLQKRAVEPTTEPESVVVDDRAVTGEVESVPITAEEIFADAEYLPPEPPLQPAPVKDDSILEARAADNAGLAKPVAKPVAEPAAKPAPAPPPLELQPIPGDNPPSFGSGAQPQIQTPPPQPSPKAPSPAAPPQPAPAPVTGLPPEPRQNGPMPSGQMPERHRQPINPNIGASGAGPQADQQTGIGGHGSAQGSPMSPPVQPPMPPIEDGVIAPWPDPEYAAPPPPPAPGQYPSQSQPYSQPVTGRPGVNARVGGSRTPANGRASDQLDSVSAHNAAQSPLVDEGQLTENIPRRMRIAIPEQVEVRIARDSVDVPKGNMQGRGIPQSHGIYVTKAMTVRLRAPEGGVRIETSSPETQWIDNALGLIHDDFASWRWTVTPERRGVTRLQLVVSARTVGADGVAAETALPDQIFDIVVRTNYILAAKQVTGWATAMAAGGVIAAFGEDAFNKILELVSRV